MRCTGFEQLTKGLLVGTALATPASFSMKGANMKQSILNFLHDESGAAAAEYALILAIVGAGIAVAAGALGTAISTAINTAKTAI